MKDFKRNSLKYLTEFLINFAIVMIVSLFFIYVDKIKINKPITNLLVIAIAISIGMTWGNFVIDRHHDEHKKRK